MVFYIKISHVTQDELVRNSATWHEEGGNTIRPEDVILVAFVNLRRIAVGAKSPVALIHTHMP